MGVVEYRLPSMKRGTGLAKAINDIGNPNLSANASLSTAADRPKEHRNEWGVTVSYETEQDKDEADKVAMWDGISK